MSATLENVPGRHESWAFIQTLRGVASLSVVLFHCLILSRAMHLEIPVALNSWLRQGEIGVDIFFIVSGFVMTVVVNSQTIDENKFSLKKFLGRRLWRVMIPYWGFTLVAVLIFAFKTKGGPEHASLIESLLLIPSNKPFYLMLGWSLVYEIWFYFLFGMCVFLAGPGRGVVLAALLCVFLASAASAFIGREVVFRIFNLTMPVYFTVGILLGTSRYKITDFLREKSWRATALGLSALAFAIAWLYLVSIHVVTGGRLATLGVASGAIFFSIWALSDILQKANWLGLQDLGDWSYSLYLSHWLLLNAIAPLLVLAHFNSPIVAIFCSAFACVIFAYLCWKFFERPVVKFGQEKFLI